MSWRTSRWAVRFGVALCLAPGLRASAQTREPGDAVEVPVAGESIVAESLKMWSLRLAGGFGFGAREFQLPVTDFEYRTETGLFPALDLGFELEHAPSVRFAVGLWLRYQSSIGLVLVEQHTDGSQQSRETRSQRMEAAIRPKLRLDDHGFWELSASVGYALSDFRPVGHLVTPAYFLAGPFARVELQLPVWRERVRLRIGPEAQWISDVGGELEQLGIVSGGFGVGGAIALEVGLSAHWRVAVSYRELRSRLAASNAQSFEDAARFGLASLTGTL